MEVSCLETISVHGVLSRQFSKLYFDKITDLPTKVVYFQFELVADSVTVAGVLN